ncbi:J domain-containing protein [Legionella shakespearei]|uniref:J domain-containing protein n=1 Tax=Legionella shakespearei DSM 23087 TaxID=1122169 RepID=A0A0W0YLT8_9GAMM|nr:DnaJ domain-containing protein [Legionella shakespearei]KTD57866.1 hypothetical protein Lsha_2144 [Legionella shakespearei DSM 23087]
MPDHTFKNFNPYAELGLNKDADPDTIKKAYKKLAKKHHPDRGGDEEQFKRIQAAYEILTRENQEAEGASGYGFNFDFDEEALAQEFVDEHDNIIFDFTGFLFVLTNTLEKIDADIDEAVITEIKKLYIKTRSIQEFLRNEDTRAFVIDKISRELKEADEELSGKEFDDFIEDYEDVLTAAENAFLGAMVLFETLNLFTHVFRSFTFDFKSKFPKESEPSAEKEKTNKKYRDQYDLERVLRKYPERKRQIIDELGDDIISYFTPNHYDELLELLDETQRDHMLTRLDWSKVQNHKFESVFATLNQAQQLIAIPLLNWKNASLLFLFTLVNSLSEAILQPVFKHMIKANPQSFADNYEARIAAAKLDAGAFRLYLDTAKTALSKNYGFPLAVLKASGITEENAQVYVDFYQPEIRAFLRKNPVPALDINPVALPFVVAELCESIKTLSDIKRYLDYVNTLPQPQVSYINLLMERIDACNLNVDQMISLLKLEREGLFHQCMVAYLSSELPVFTLSPKHLSELKAVLNTTEFDELSPKFKMEKPVTPEPVQQENKNFFFYRNLVRDPVLQDRIERVLDALKA